MRQKKKKKFLGVTQPPKRKLYAFSFKHSHILFYFG